MSNSPARPTAEGSRILAMWHENRALQRQLGQRRSAPVRSVRSFAAAEVSRLTSSFQADHESMNLSLESSLRIMVGRSRSLAKNNDYVRHFLRMCQNHIVGPEGFRLHVPCLRLDGTLDEADSLVVERAFARFTKRGVIDVTGRWSLRMLCRLLVLCWARDGEFLVRRVRARKANAFGYQLQVLDPVLLDYTYRADLGNGNRVRMGVEINDIGAPQAYHLLSNVENGLAQRRARVLASEIWHHFTAEEPDQVRGIPWIFSAMRRLNDLGGYEQAAVIAARIGASKMGFFTEEADAPGGPISTQELADDQVDGELITDADPGVFSKLPPGVDFKSFNPDYPHQNYDVFVKACLRGVASGMGVDYNTLGNDLTDVNYSSIRHGMLETRELWTNLQNDFKEAFLEPLYSEWLDMAFVSGQLDPLPVSKFAKYDVGQWQGRRWAWIDPKGDTDAKLLEIDNGLNSYSAYIRESGRDPVAVWRELEKDKKRLAGLINPKPGTPPPANPGATA